ncbi:NADH-quinone oxidoreductase subunit H [Salmonella enterica subsp. enterica]|nr:NADH-quinone oxidoreductase subunit H [Salmonella enterica subsp. enterica]
MPQLGDLITLIYLFAIARFFFYCRSGWAVRKSFTAIGASREATCSACWWSRFCCWVCGSPAGGGFNSYQQYRRQFILSLACRAQYSADSGVVRLRLRHLIEMGKLPFDRAEAEQELQEAAVDRIQR